MSGFRVNWNDSEARAIVQAGGSSAVRDCANFLLDESRKQVPIDTGALSRSGNVSSEGLSATVYYDTVYAIIQHEKTGYSHQRGRKAKYLEDPCNDTTVKARMMDYFGNGIKF